MSYLLRYPILYVSIRDAPILISDIGPILTQKVGSGVDLFNSIMHILRDAPAVCWYTPAFCLENKNSIERTKIKGSAVWRYLTLVQACCCLTHKIMIPVFCPHSEEYTGFRSVLKRVQYLTPQVLLTVFGLKKSDRCLPSLNIVIR